MITPTDLWITFGFGAASGVAWCAVVAAIRRYRARRRLDLELRHWRAVHLFRW